MAFHNVYEDEKRAEAYARLEFPGTYYLAYRDLPAIIADHVSGRKALDFSLLEGRSFDLVQSVFTSDNVPTREQKARIFRGLHDLLNDDGKIVSLVSSPALQARVGLVYHEGLPGEQSREDR